MEYNKKSVGLIGYWFATNYGGVASYYSLYQAVKELGYAPFLVETPLLDVDKEGVDVFSRNFFKEIGAQISDFLKTEDLEKLNQFADMFVLGSDQVITNTSIRLFGKLFLMEFAEKNKLKIAFSSSCGGDNLENSKTTDYAKNLISRFDKISVREFSAIDIFRNRFDIDVDFVIDPIFLTTAAEFKRLGQLSGLKEDKDYLLAYILDPTSEKKRDIYELSSKLDLKRKVALDGRKYTYEKNYELLGMGDEILPELNFPEWLHYFTNASYILTDSFHGAAMALILNKPFLMYANYKRGYPRFVTLSTMFGIESRLLKNGEGLRTSLIDEQINYERVNRIIKEQREYAMKWLEEALKGEKNALVKNPVLNGIILQKDKIEKLYKNPDFRKIRILVTLLRDYNVRHIVLSPGGRDVPIVRMFEYNEEYFILHRVVDERSAAYYGLGLAAQLQQPVACVCTSGTAVSNYLPAVTEAYFTGVPLIMITADRYEIYHGQGEDQTIPQNHVFAGVIKKEFTVPEGDSYNAIYQTRRDISDCILESTHNGYGPVHINIGIGNISEGADVHRDHWKLLPQINPHILRVGFNDGNEQLKKWAVEMKKSSRILIVYGQNPPANERQIKFIETFIEKYNCVIVTDLISNLNCKHCLKPYNMLLAISQQEFDEQLAPDILITVGGKRLMNDPLTFKIRKSKRGIRHWSVTPDGNIKDFYFRLTSVLEMSQDKFFEWFTNNAGDVTNNNEYFNRWKEFADRQSVPTILHFDSNYVQSRFIPAIPPNSILHLGVGQSFYDSRRYELDKTVSVFCNMGTNGIDGCTSTFMGQCAVVKDRLCFLLVGDLSFFYDMNSIWNKSLGNNIRILLVNNKGSGLLRNNNLRAISSEHNASAKGWVENCGFKYISADNEKDFEKLLKWFLSEEPNAPLFFEVFCQ